MFRTATKSLPMHQVEMNGNTFKRSKTGHNTDHLVQDFYIASADLWHMCKPHEWHLVGRISSELKKYNALWYCDPALKTSSSTKIAIKELIRKGVLSKTETTNIYFVNPVYIRRGDFKTVLATTACMLSGVKRVTTDHIRDNDPVTKFSPSQSHVIALKDN